MLAPIPDASRPLSSATRLPALFPGAHRAQGRQVLGTPPSLRPPLCFLVPQMFLSLTMTTCQWNSAARASRSGFLRPAGRLKAPASLAAEWGSARARARGHTLGAACSAALHTHTPVLVRSPVSTPLGERVRGGAAGVGELAVQPPASRTGDGPPASSAAAASPTRVSRPGRSLVLSFLFPFLPSLPHTPPSFFLSITTRGL